MHDGVIWFDTAGCLDGGFIGQVNDAGAYGSRRLDGVIGQNNPTSQDWSQSVAADKNGVDHFGLANSWNGPYGHDNGSYSQSALDNHNAAAVGF